MKHVEDGMLPHMYLNWQPTPGSSPQSPRPVSLARPGDAPPTPVRQQQPPRITRPLAHPTPPLNPVVQQAPITKPLPPEHNLPPNPGVPFVVTAELSRGKQLRNWSQEQWRRLLRRPAITLVNRSQDYTNGFNNGFERGHNRGCRRGCAVSLLAVFLAGGALGGVMTLEQAINQSQNIHLTLSPNECVTAIDNTIAFGSSVSIDGQLTGNTPNTGVVAFISPSSSSHEICSIDTPVQVDIVNDPNTAKQIWASDVSRLKTSGCNQAKGCSQVLTITK